MPLRHTTASTRAQPHEHTDRQRERWRADKASAASNPAAPATFRKWTRARVRITHVAKQLGNRLCPRQGKHLGKDLPARKRIP
jgi:hypothetical protein